MKKLFISSSYLKQTELTWYKPIPTQRKKISCHHGIILASLFHSHSNTNSLETRLLIVAYFSYFTHTIKCTCAKIPSMPYDMRRGTLHMSSKSSQIHTNETFSRHCIKALDL